MVPIPIRHRYSEDDSPVESVKVKLKIQRTVSFKNTKTYFILDPDPPNGLKRRVLML